MSFESGCFYLYFENNDALCSNGTTSLRGMTTQHYEPQCHNNANNNTAFGIMTFLVVTLITANQ